MYQNNWLAQQLTYSHQRQLREKADRACQTQDAQQNKPVRKYRRMIDKLRAEMTTL